jgi:hypothetical protein
MQLTNLQSMRETSSNAKTKIFIEEEKGECLSFLFIDFVKIAKLAKSIKCFVLNIKT